MPQSTCEYCAATFETTRPSGRRFCFDCLKPYNNVGKHLLLKRCYDSRYYQLEHGCIPTAVRLRAPSRKSECATCGDSYRFPLGDNSALRIYCDTCRKSHRRLYKTGGRLTGAERECRWCLLWFTQNQHNQLTCSDDCARQLKYHFSVYGAPDRCHIKLCIKCAHPIAGRPMNRLRCFDCEAERRNVSEARRALAVAIGDRGIHWSTVGERDGWACHLCLRRVTRKAGTSDERSGAVVDHLVPIAAGGSHTWDNVAVAHWDCNQSRGHTGPAQLRLVG
jgi:5-methylcytosine-specific restriction endonuclease McrA